MGESSLTSSWADSFHEQVKSHILWQRRFGNVFPRSTKKPDSVLPLLFILVTTYAPHTRKAVSRYGPKKGRKP